MKLFLVILSSAFSIFAFSCASSPQQQEQAVEEASQTIGTAKSDAVAKPVEVETGNIDSDFYSLKAKVEDLNNRLYVITEQQETLRSRLNDAGAKSMTELEKEDALNKNIQAFQAVSAEMKKSYQRAYQMYKDGKFAKSLLAFSNFIEKYPNSTLTDNAYFWLGECYFEQKEYAMAIDEYLKVLKKFTDPSKGPDAMFKIGVSYNFLGEKPDAESYFKELITRYPSSKTSLLAKAELEKLDNKKEK